MPVRNTIRIDEIDSHYHIYGRGRDKSPIFLNARDYFYFLKLFSRYLSEKPQYNDDNRQYPHLAPQIELTCFCLMPNHFHLLVFQKDRHAMSRLMQSVLTSYCLFFNQAYNHTGPLLESRFKAAYVKTQPHLEHISRYIHLNPDSWENYQYSSLPYYLGLKSAEWLKNERISGLFSSKDDYLQFLTNT